MIAYHGVFLEYIQRCSDREVLVMDEKDNMRQRCLYHMISNKYEWNILCQYKKNMKTANNLGYGNGNHDAK